MRRSHGRSSPASPSRRAVTTESDVAEAVWRAANDASGPLRFPAGPDAVALARRNDGRRDRRRRLGRELAPEEDRKPGGRRAAGRGLRFRRRPGGNRSGGKRSPGDGASADASLNPEGAARLRARAVAALTRFARAASAAYSNVRSGRAGAICGELDAGDALGRRSFVVTPNGAAMIGLTSDLPLADPNDPFPDLQHAILCVDRGA